MASSSSMNTMEGACSCAVANSVRIFASLSPLKPDTTSGPDNFKNGTPSSPAIAWASSVLPHPVGPNRRTPQGGFTPKWRYISGLRRGHSMSSRTSSSLHSMPPMSEYRSLGTPTSSNARPPPLSGPVAVSAVRFFLRVALSPSWRLRFLLAPCPSPACAGEGGGLAAACACHAARMEALRRLCCGSSTSTTPGSTVSSESESSESLSHASKRSGLSW
mmetsp:Transcript_20172/g.77226  ORF Transcript_20172/g.77226 Transcript_20172/m.77226 type:complete len:218 (-) Transcript_20172:241-894(-)